MKVLEHCCYPKYLSSWWESNRSEGVWHLVHFGDHMMWELVRWFANMCYDGTPASVTVAMPVVSQQAADELRAMRMANVSILSGREGVEGAVVVPDIHTMMVTVSGRDRFITLSGGLLQAYAPGKYITTVTLTREAFDAIQPQLESWKRFYTRKNSKNA